MDVEFEECEGEKNTSIELGEQCGTEGGCGEDGAPVDQKSNEEDGQGKKSDEGRDHSVDTNAEGEEDAGGSKSSMPGSTEATKEPQEEMEEKRFQEERKRKGKEKAVPPPKKKRISRPASRTVTIREPSPAAMEISDSDESSDSDSSFYVEEGESAQDSDTSLVDSDEERELISYEVMEVEVEQEDAEEWKNNQDNRRFRTHQQVHVPSLVQMGIKSEFIHVLHTLGFEWFLLLEVDPIPQGLAREFFSSFSFRVTTDLDETCISFTLFGVEYSMSLTEWAARLGIMTMEEAVGVGFRSSERGVPNKHCTFDGQEAWSSWQERR